MRNKSIILWAALGLWILYHSPVQAAPEPTIKQFYISEASVRLYGGPSEKNQVRGYLAYSTPVNLLEKKGNWYHIRNSQSKPPVQGWVKGHLLSTTKIPPQPFVHSGHRYALNYPEKGVRFQAVDEDTLYLKIDPREPLAVIGIQVGYSTQETLEKVVETHPLSLPFQHQQLEDEGRTGLLFIREQKKTVLNGQPTWYTHFYLHSRPLPSVGLITPTGITTLEGRQYLVFKNGKVFSLTVAAPHTKYPSWATVFEKSVKSFKLQ